MSGYYPVILSTMRYNNTLTGNLEHLTPAAFTSITAENSLDQLESVWWNTSTLLTMATVSFSYHHGVVMLLSPGAAAAGHVSPAGEAGPPGPPGRGGQAQLPGAGGGGQVQQLGAGPGLGHPHQPVISVVFSNQYLQTISSRTSLVSFISIRNINSINFLS